MHSLVYMLARTIVTYTMFKATRGVMQFGTKQISSLPNKLKLWDCPRCGKMWTGDPDGEDKCGNCNSYLIPKHYVPKDEEQEEIILAS